MLDLNLRVETRTEIITSPSFTATTLQLAINSLIATKVTGLVQLLMPAYSYCPEPPECVEFQAQNSCIELSDTTKALKLESLAGIGSPPGTVNLVNGITYVTASGIIISYGFGLLLDVSEPSTPEYVWRVEHSGEANPPIYIDGTGTRIPFNTNGGIFLFQDGSLLIMTLIDDILSFKVRYILPTNLNIPGSGLTKQSVQGFDPDQISVFLNQATCGKVQDGTLADMFPLTT
ncbi:MAG: hypothetical protein P4L49_11645 [Desulfosporosinus sp.]|nr:hypothetical protein [Desulfosporosinus sp.]